MGGVQEDLRIHIHAGAETVSFVNTNGDRVGGDAAGGSACNGNIGNYAGIYLALCRVSGNLDLLPHGNLRDVQLINVQRHFQITHIVDDAQRTVRAALNVVAGLGVLGDNSAGDGSGDRIVVQTVLGVFQGSGGIAEADASAFNLIICGAASDGADPLTAGDGIAWQPVQAADFTRDLSSNDAGRTEVDGGLAIAGIAADGSDSSIVLSNQPWVGSFDLYRDRLQSGVGGDGGRGDRCNGAGGSAVKVSDVNGSCLPYIKVRGTGVGEQEGHINVVVPYNPHKLCPCADALTVFHIYLRDCAAHIRRGVFGVHCLLVVGLRLGVRILGLGLAAGSIGGIQRIEKLSLLYLVTLFKGITEDLSGHQRIDRIGVCRFQCPAAREGFCDIAGLSRGGLIGCRSCCLLTGWEAKKESDANTYC